MVESVRLKIAEAYTRDVACGIIRIDYDTMDKLSVNAGEYLKITCGDKFIGAKVLPLYPSDEGKQLGRIDGMLRDNLEIQRGDEVEVQKTKVTAAISLDVTLNEKINVEGRYIAKALNQIAVKENQWCIFPYFGGRIQVRIINISPKGIMAVINEKTIINNLTHEKTFEIFCKYCNGVVENKTSFAFCNVDHQIRWTIRDELKNVGIHES